LTPTDSVVLHPEDQKRIRAYFRSLPDLSHEIKIEDSVLAKTSDMDNFHKQAYLKDLYEMTRKGLYYYDKLKLGDYFDYKYYLKASPLMPLLNVNIDPSIFKGIASTKIEGEIKDLKLFNVSEIS